MIYNMYEIADGVLFEIEGSFTFRCHDIFLDMLSYVRQFKPNNVFIDMKKCDFVDSAALSMMVMLNDEISLYTKNKPGLYVSKDTRLFKIMNECKLGTIYDFKDVAPDVINKAEGKRKGFSASKTPKTKTVKKSKEPTISVLEVDDGQVITVGNKKYKVKLKKK